jgi:hypothetical protein
VLAVVSAAASIAVFTVGTSGPQREASAGYFIGALLAMLLAGVFTYLALTSKRDDL